MAPQSIALTVLLKRTDRAPMRFTHKWQPVKRLLVGTLIETQIKIIRFDNQKQ